MKKFIISITLIMILCSALGSSYAHSFEEITVGMDQNDVTALLQEYTITEQAKYYLEYSDQESRIQILFRDGKVSSVRLWMDGRKDSDLDFLHPDWNISEAEMLGKLKSDQLYYWFDSEGTYFFSSGKKEIRHYGFYGKMGTLPVDYTLIYSDDGLEQIYIRSIESSETLLGFIDWVNCLTKELGPAEDAWSFEDMDMGEDENSFLLFLSDYTKWTHSGNEYDLALTTTIKKDPEIEGMMFKKQGHEMELTICRVQD